jgi:hypothetical protein
MLVVRIVMSVVVVVVVAPMAMSMTMIVQTMERENTDQIYQKTQSTDKEKLRRSADICTSKQPLDRFVDDLDADEHEKDTISQACQSIDFPIAIGKLEAGRPFAHDSSTNTDQQSHAVEEHVYAVTDQPQRSCQDTICGLDHHEAQIQNHEIKDPPRIAVCEDAMQERVSFGRM